LTYAAFIRGLCPYAACIKPMKNPDSRSDNTSPVKAVQNKDADNILPPGADAEERFNEFWRSNGPSIFMSIAIGAVIVVGAQTWRYMQQRMENNTQSTFLQAETAEELNAFAQDNASHPLAGASYMQLANEEYARGEYRQASEHYEMAKDRLTASAFAERAQLGIAMCELLSGNTEEALSDLRAILNNPDMLQVTRAEAGYNLALHYYKAGDYKALTEILDIADSFEDGNQYASATSALRYRIPATE